MRSEGYSSCPVCVSVCLSVSPHAILEVRAITSKTKDTIILSVEFEAIVKRHFSLKASGSKVTVLLLTSVGTANLS